MVAVRGGVHYPRSWGEFLSWFATDEDCLDYLEWLRWPAGFVCPGCGDVGGWRLGDGRFKCAACGRRSSVTAGTIFDRTRTPLTVWFSACWTFATARNGVSALHVKRTLEIGSYQTAWAMLHRLRSVLVRPGRDRLSGRVEVDETFIGGEEEGLAGGRAKGKKVLVGVTVERTAGRRFGRARMAILPDATAGSLRTLLIENVEPGSTVLTDGWPAYPQALGDDYAHERLVAPRRDAMVVLPAVHRVAALAKRWLLGTHQGTIQPEHLASYLNEFVFRFNRRTSRSPGLLFYRILELAVAHEPVRYRTLVANPASVPRQPPGPRFQNNPPSLHRPAAHRPWRTTNQPRSG